MRPGRHTRVRATKGGQARAGRRRLRLLRTPLVLFVGAFALASGTAAFAYTTASGSGSGQAQAVRLAAPGPGTATAPTATSLAVSWAASPGLPAKAGYLVLRSTTSGGPYEKISSGTCQQAATLVSAATSCTDSGLAPGTTYYYVVEADYYDVDTIWVSPPDAQFSGTTSQGKSPVTSGSPAPAPSPTRAPHVTSANATSFLVGAPGSFQVTASGSPAPGISDAAFSGCTPSPLPSDVTLSGTGLLSGTPAVADVGTFTLCINAANGVSPNASQQFTLTIANQVLAFSSPAVSGASSSSPNLGPITVRRQTAGGAPITAGGALTVNLTSSPSSGATFGTTAFATAPVTSVTIPSGQSTATLWYGSPTPGSPALTASAAGYVAGSQVETITAAPAGLGVTLGPAAGGTPAPVLSCGPPAQNDMCTISAVGATGSVALTVGFRNANGTPAVYSATQASAVKASGQSSGSVTIGAGAAASSPGALTAALGTSSLSFGPYTLVINVSS